MFITIVLAILFVIYGIPLLLTLLAAIFEWICVFFEDNPAAWWIIVAIVIIVILCIVW